MAGLFKPVLFALDLGGGSLKVVRLRKKKVLLASYIDIPQEVRDDESRLISTLHDFFKSINIIGRQVIVQLPGNLSFIRSINFPPMPHAELREAVKWEVKRQIPYPIEEAVYDYVAVARGEGIAVTFAAGQRKAIEGYISPFRQAGVSVTAVDASPLCLMRAIKPRTPGNAILLDVGSLSTEINIIKAGTLRMTRTVDLGGAFIRQYLLEGGKDPVESEKALREGTEEELKAPLDELYEEVRRSMDYYKANFKEKTFSEVMLTGGVAINISLKNYFSHMLDIPVYVPEPFEGLILSDETIRTIGPRFSVAIGLARRAD